MANELPQISDDEFLSERNSAVIKRDGIFPDPVVKGPEDLNQIAELSSVPEFLSVIKGRRDIDDLPKDMWNPVLLGLAIKDLQIHSSLFDQEANNVIVQRGPALHVINEKQANGVYALYSNGYNEGRHIDIEGGETITRMHSHPPGKQLVNDALNYGQILDKKEVELFGNLPSNGDLVFLLERKPKEGEKNLECPSIIVVGPQMAILVTRTNQTPEFREQEGDSHYQLLKEMNALKPKEGANELEIYSKQFFNILKKYNLAMYTYPLDEKNSGLLWSRFYPNPENVQ